MGYVRDGEEICFVGKEHCNGKKWSREWNQIQDMCTSVNRNYIFFFFGNATE